MNAITAETIAKSFVNSGQSKAGILFGKPRKHNVFENLSFEVKKGEIVGILGKNGAGKSTLLRCVAGVYGIDAGKITTVGKIASVFELGSFFNKELSGEKYCRDYFEFMGIPSHQAASLIKSIHEFTELEEFFYKPVRTYSSGMMAKLLFGTATSLPAAIILIDEVLVVGDEYFQAKAWARMRKFLENDSSGMIVSHDWTALLKLCERTLILSDGKMEFIGNTYKAVQKYVAMENTIAGDKPLTIANAGLLRKGLRITENAPLDVNILIHKEKSFHETAFNFSFSIDRLIKGVGWAQALSGNETVRAQPEDSDISCRLFIEKPELSPGDYFLGISLNPAIDKEKPVISLNYDIMHWLNGNEISLTVTGNEQTSSPLFNRKFEWKVQPA